MNSCRKPDNSLATQIEVVSPKENSFFILPATIQAEIVVTADKVPQYIRVSVCNSQQIPVFTPVYFYPESMQSFYSFDYVMDEMAIENEGALYFLVTVVTDEVVNSYTKIAIENQPIEYKGFYLFTRPSVNETKVAFVDDDLVLNNIAIVYGDFLTSAASTKHDMLYFISETPDRMYANQFGEEPFSWDIEPSADYPEFTALYTEGNTVYCGYGNGKIAGFTDVSGQQIVNTLPKRDSIPEKLITTKDYLVGDFRIKNKVTRSLSIFYKVTGSELQRSASSVQVINFYTENMQNDLFIFGNENGKAVYSKYSFEENYLSNSIQISSEPMTASCRIGESVFLFCVNRQVHSFNTKTLISKQLLDLGSDIVAVDFNATQQLVFLTTSGFVYFYNYPAMQLLGTFSSDEPIKGIELRYAN